MKKMLALLLASLLCLGTMMGCSKEKTNNDAGDVPGEIMSAGNVKALIPEGWAVFWQPEVFTDDPDDIDPNIIKVCKGGETDMDLFYKPYIQINYAGSDTVMLEPDKSWYEDVVDLKPTQYGTRTWNGFTAVDSYGKMAMLWTKDGEHQFQATMWLEIDGNKISLEDKDVIAILASVAPANGEASNHTTSDMIETSSETTSDTASEPEISIPQQLIDRYKGDWSGALMLYDCTGTYESWADGSLSLAIARINVDEKGNVTPFIGLSYGSSAFRNLEAQFLANRGSMMINGIYKGNAFTNVEINEYEGTLSISIPVVAEDGTIHFAINLRRLGDEGWTTEEPGFAQEQIDYYKGYSLEQLAVLCGYQPTDYPAAEN